MYDSEVPSLLGQSAASISVVSKGVKVPAVPALAASCCPCHTYAPADTDNDTALHCLAVTFVNKGWEMVF